MPPLRHLKQSPAAGLLNVVTVRSNSEYVQIQRRKAHRRQFTGTTILLSLLVEKLFQSSVPRPAHRQSRAIIQNDHVTVIAVRLEPRDSLQIDQVRTMNAHKVLRIKRRLKS